MDPVPTSDRKATSMLLFGSMFVNWQRQFVEWLHTYPYGLALRAHGLACDALVRTLPRTGRRPVGQAIFRMVLGSKGRMHLAVRSIRTSKDNSCCSYLGGWLAKQFQLDFRPSLGPPASNLVDTAVLFFSG